MHNTSDDAEKVHLRQKLDGIEATNNNIRSHSDIHTSTERESQRHDKCAPQLFTSHNNYKSKTIHRIKNDMIKNPKQLALHPAQCQRNQRWPAPETNDSFKPISANSDILVCYQKFDIQDSLKF